MLAARLDRQDLLWLLCKRGLLATKMHKTLTVATPSTVAIEPERMNTNIRMQR